MADTPQTVIAPVEQIATDEVKKMLNPFGLMKSVPLYDAMKPRWINISGEGKIGKTQLMNEIAKHLRMLYFDWDPLLSTASYEGYYVRNQSWQDIFIAVDKYKNLCKTAPVKPQVVVIDTLDGLSDFIKKDVMQMGKTDDLLKMELQMPGGAKGNGYTLIHARFIDILSTVQAMAPLMITITHPKLSSLGKFETVTKSVKGLNLIGSMKSYVQQACDANLWFRKVVDSKGKEKINISGDPGDDFSIGDGFGIRPFKGLQEANTAEKFVDYIVSNFK